MVALSLLLLPCLQNIPSMPQHEIHDCVRPNFLSAHPDLVVVDFYSFVAILWKLLQSRTVGNSLVKFFESFTWGDWSFFLTDY